MNKGFSLMEVMIGLAMLGGLSVGIMNLSQDQRQALDYYEHKGIELELFNQIRYVLLNKEACGHTLNGLNVSSPVTFTTVNNDANTPFVTVGQYFTPDESVQLSGLQVFWSAVPPGGGESVVLVRVSITRDATISGTFNKDIYLTVRADAGSVITECLTAEDSTTELGKAEMCAMVNGTYVTGPPSRCNLNCPSPMSSGGDSNAISVACLENYRNTTLAARYAFERDQDSDGIADTITGDLNVQGTISATNDIIAGTSLCVGSNCHDFSGSTCSPGQVVRGIGADGQLECAGLSCDPNEYFWGFDGSFNPRCQPYNPSACPPGQYVETVNPDGSVSCGTGSSPTDKNCDPGEYIQAISAGGVPTCISEVGVTTDNCLSGQGVYNIDNGVISCRVYSDTNVFGQGCTGVGEFIQGFQADGTPICVTASTPATGCSGGVTWGETRPVSELHICFANVSSLAEGGTDVVSATGCTINAGPLNFPTGTFTANVSCTAGVLAVTSHTGCECNP